MNSLGFARVFRPLFAHIWVRISADVFERKRRPCGLLAIRPLLLVQPRRVGIYSCHKPATMRNTRNVGQNIDMPLIELKTKIAAPMERVFDLARSIDADMASTEGSNEKAVAGRTSGLIEDGETVTWEAKHFGIKQRLAVRITSYDRPHVFGDEMITGAFAAMHHTHRFTPSGEGTLMKDEFHFTAPFGFLGRIAEGLFLTGYMRRFLVKRAAKLKAMAESEEWRRYLPNMGDPVSAPNR